MYMYIHTFMHLCMHVYIQICMYVGRNAHLRERSGMRDAHFLLFPLYIIHISDMNMHTYMYMYIMYKCI